MNKRPTWFKCFLSSKAVLDSIADENVGKGLKAAFAYFDDGTVTELDPLSYVAFSALKPYIDEAVNDYEKRVQDGRSGACKRWGNE